MSHTSLFITILLLLSLELHNVASFGLLCKYLSERITTSGNSQVNFFVYANKNGSPVQVTCNKNCNLTNLRFNPNLPTIVIIHGFLSDQSANWIQALIKTLNTKGDMNIIVVDWSSSIELNYYKTASKTLEIAAKIKTLLIQVAKTSNTDLTNWPYLYFIGHSMGAHIAGQAALMLREKVFVHRITAVDPARPYFHKEGANLKLHKSHAQFVDVIHTNSAPNEETLGLYEPLGHIDFYPNGGDRQPGCNLFGKKRKRTFIESLKCWSKLIFGVDLIALKKNYLARKLQGDDMLCDHREGQKYLIESISGKSTFLAKKVDRNSDNAAVTACPPANCIGNGCVEMGINANRYIDPYYHGVYYVNTQCRYA